MTLDGKEITLTELEKARGDLKLNENGPKKQILEVAPGVFKTLEKLNG